MKTFSKSLILTAMVAIPMAVGTGCSREVSHTESDKPGWFGGNTHEEKTVYKNADGSYSTQTEKQHTD